MILDGKKISKEIKEEIKKECYNLKLKYHDQPKLTVIVVGNDEPSQIYVRNKRKACEYCGILFDLISFSDDVSIQEIKKTIEKLNFDKTVNGIIVQLPLPSHLDENMIINCIAPHKDVDGFGLLNKGALFVGEDAFVPATPFGIMKLLEKYQIPIMGKHVVVVGRSNIVGKPIAMMMLKQNATVTIVHSKTPEIDKFTQTADILVVAIGKPKYITKEMVKEHATIIDVGINRVQDYICGDVDFENMKDYVDYITPVPGGVGPLTIASLLKNTVKAYKQQKELN